VTCSLTVKSVSDGCPSRAGSPRLAKSCIAQPFFITGTGVFSKPAGHLPLVNVYIAMKNHYFSWVNPL
jgi:hypothetical protein